MTLGMLEYMQNATGMCGSGQIPFYIYAVFPMRVGN
jgi:hypothetical protein